MQINIPNSILENTSLSSSAKLLYGFLLSRQSENNERICTLTSQKIADTIGLERTAIPRLVKVLEAEGLLKAHEGYSVKNRLQYSYEALVK